MIFSIIVSLLPLAFCYPYYYYQQQMPNSYQQSLYAPRYNVPSFYYNNYYQRPCQRCGYQNVQQQGSYYQNIQSYSTKNQNPSSGYQRPSQLLNEYNNYKNEAPFVPNYQTGDIQSTNVDLTNNNIPSISIQNTDTSIPLLTATQGPISFVSDKQNFHITEDKKEGTAIVVNTNFEQNNQQTGIEITNTPQTSETFEVVPTNSATEYRDEIPLSISKDSIPTINRNVESINSNAATGEVPVPKIEFNKDSEDITSKVNEATDNGIKVKTKSDIDYVLYQEVAASQKNGTADFYDTPVTNN
uniref:DUF4774 domain-containing protein n=1 Tax=Parastrongyloides trichosuri TaxID=131310 RepID=A0A0N5A6J7_PARTI